MRFAAVLALAAAFVLHHAAPARALGWEAHYAACAIAWDELTPPIRTKVEDILGEKGREAFALSCRWADDVRRWRPETAPWHYVNAAPGSTTVDMARDCSPPEGCLLGHILPHLARLGNPGARDDLRYLAHFVGDLHAPLHVGYAADRGGTDIKGTFEGVDTNLHAIWDFNMLDAAAKSWQATAADLHGRITNAERKQWAAGTPLDWANESLAIALSPAVGYHPYSPPGFIFGEDYAKTNLPTLYRQIEKAGVRLAWLLTESLK